MNLDKIIQIIILIVFRLRCLKLLPFSYMRPRQQRSLCWFTVTETDAISTQQWVQHNVLWRHSYWNTQRGGTLSKHAQMNGLAS